MVCLHCGKLFKWRKSHRTHIKSCQGSAGAGGAGGGGGGGVAAGGAVGMAGGGGVAGSGTGVYVPALAAQDSALTALTHAALLAPLAAAQPETPVATHTQEQPTIALAPVVQASLAQPSVGQPVYHTLTTYNMANLQVSPTSREYMTSPQMQANVQCTPQTHN